MSISVYLQMVGRVLRVKPDNSRAIILDHVGCVARHGLPNAPREWTLNSTKVRAQAAAVRVCPKCYATFAPAPRCPECGVACASAAPPRKAPKAVAGDLAEVTGDNYLATAPLKSLVKAARTLEDIKKIAAARGYKDAWVTKQYSFKLEARRRWGCGGRDEPADGWGRHT